MPYYRILILILQMVSCLFRYKKGKWYCSIEIFVQACLFVLICIYFPSSNRVIPFRNIVFLTISRDDPRKFIIRLCARMFKRYTLYACAYAVSPHSGLIVEKWTLLFQDRAAPMSSSGKNREENEEWGTDRFAVRSTRLYGNQASAI